MANAACSLTADYEPPSGTVQPPGNRELLFLEPPFRRPAQYRQTGGLRARTVSSAIEDR
jgi:hypothetical protein